MKELVTICILGDICSAWGFRESFDLGDESKVFGDVLPLLQQADYTVANLECPLSLRGTPAQKTGPRLRGKPSDLQVLKRAGIKAVSLANNHILDYGQDAFLDTIQGLRTEKINFFGAGADPKAAKAPLIVEIKGWKIGFLSFAEEEFSIVSDKRGGAHLFDPYTAFAEISETRSRCDYLILLYHGGIEHYPLPSPLLQKKCRSMVSSGADLVLCQHSHCIGTLEDYKGGKILYGQGNAVFGIREGKMQWNLGMLAELSLAPGKTELSFRVFVAKQDGIVLYEGESERLEQMYEDSARLGDSSYIQNQWDTFCLRQEPGYVAELMGWGRAKNKLNRLCGNILVKRLSRKKKMISMNLIRCDSHREVIQRILETSQK